MRITILAIAFAFVSQFSQAQTTLNDLNDVSTAGATTGQVLTKTNRGWKASPVSSGSAPASQLIYGTGGGTTSSIDLTYASGLFQVQSTTPTTPTINVKRIGDAGAAIFQMENTNNKWIFYASGNDFGIEPQTADAIFKIRNLANANLWQITTSSGIIQNSAGTYYRVTGLDTDTKIKLAAFDASNDLGDVTLGTGFSISGGALTYNRSWLAAADTGTPAEISDSETLTIAGGEGIDTEISGNTVTTTLDLSELTVETSLGGNEYFPFYDSGNTSQWLAHIDSLLRYFENNAVIRSIYNPSGLLPDFGTYVNSDGAGFEITADAIDIQGVDVTVNGTPISIRTQDTLFIPIYAHPHDEAITTGTADYRGWRVPADLNGAKIEAIQYSFDTPGSDTVTIQLTNGTINIAGSTIPIAGYVENTAVSQTLTTGEKWTPTIGTINGTGHEGLMVNLMIVR